jgi:hypothetical protein
MKKIFLLLAISLIAAMPLMADTVTINSQFSSNAGGLFNVTTVAYGSFGTFCIETSEYLAIGGKYDYLVSDAAKYNNVSPANTDPISKATAWLFVNYASVTGFDSSAAAYGAVQEAIWYLEGEGGVANAYYIAATTGAQFGFESVDANGAFGVHVMNLYELGHAGEYDYRKQDLLVVPEGGITIILLGLGVGFISLYSRKVRD